MNKRVGDVVPVETPGGVIHFRITKVE